MSAEKKIKTNIQNSTVNSWINASSKWHDPHINEIEKFISKKGNLTYFIVSLEKTRPGLNKRSNADEVVHFCNLQLVETVPDVLVEKRISRQLTKQSIFHVID